MTFPESNRKSPEEQAEYFQEEFRTYLKGLHEVSFWGKDAYIMTGQSIPEYIAGNIMYLYHQIHQGLILEVSVNKDAFYKLKEKIPEKPNTSPRVRNEIVRKQERYVVRISPPVSQEELAKFADESVLQFDTDWEIDGIVVKEVPHPDLPERLKRDFLGVVIAPQEILDITVLPFTPAKRTKTTFKTVGELLQEQLERAEALGKWFDLLAQDNSWLKQQLEKDFDELPDVIKGFLGGYPSDKECGIDEDSYWYFYTKYGENGEITDSEDRKLLENQWEALQKRAKIDMKWLRRLCKAKDN